MRELTPSQKGAAAEAAFAAAAIRLGVRVLLPLGEGGRYDLVLDLEPQLVRVQCKWATLRGGVIEARSITSRHTPRGYVRTIYTADEIDAIGAFCPENETCYLIPAGADRREGQPQPPPRAHAEGLVVARGRAGDFELASSLAASWGVGPDPCERADRRVARR